MKKNEYAETLVEYVKEVGKFLEENADKIVPDVPFIGDLTLEITFDQEMGSWPQLNVYTTVFPGHFERFNELTDIVKEKYKEKEN